MEDRDHRRHTIDQLKSEPQVHQHPGQRINRRQQRLVAQLLAHLRSNNLNVEYVKARQVTILLQLGHHARISNPIQRIDTWDQPTMLLIAEVGNRPGLRSIFSLGTRTQVARILLHH